MSAETGHDGEGAYGYRAAVIAGVLLCLPALLSYGLLLPSVNWTLSNANGWAVFWFGGAVAWVCLYALATLRLRRPGGPTPPWAWVGCCLGVAVELTMLDGLLRHAPWSVEVGFLLAPLCTAMLLMLPRRWRGGRR